MPLGSYLAGAKSPILIVSNSADCNKRPLVKPIFSSVSNPPLYIHCRCSFTSDCTLAVRSLWKVFLADKVVPCVLCELPCPVEIIILLTVVCF